MIFDKIFKNNLNEHWVAINEFNSYLESEKITEDELIKKYRILLIPVENFLNLNSHKSNKKINQLRDAFNEERHIFYRTLYKLDPKERNEEYENKNKEIRALYNMLLNKANADNDETRTSVDAYLKEGYRYLVEENKKYGYDSKFNELQENYYKLRNYFYNDLKGTKYYLVDLGEHKEYEYELYSDTTSTIYVDTKKISIYTIDDEGSRDVPIYAIDDEKGLRIIALDIPLREKTVPNFSIYDGIMYDSLTPVDEESVASDIEYIMKYKKYYFKQLKHMYSNCQDVYYVSYMKECRKQEENRLNQEKENGIKLLNKSKNSI